MTGVPGARPLTSIYPHHHGAGLPQLTWPLAKSRGYLDLGVELGTHRIIDGDYQTSYLGRGNFFLEDDPQSEEGKSFEKQVFGMVVGRLSIALVRNSWLHPGPSALTSWPRPLGNPRSSEWKGRHSCGNYTTYLKDPPPPFFSTVRPLPVATANRYLRKDFWAADVARFGPKGLKIPSEAFPLMKMKMDLDPRIPQMQSAFGDAKEYKRLGRARGDLWRAGNIVINGYVQQVVDKVLKTPMFQKELHFWKREWARTDARIEVVCARAEKFFTAFSETAAPVFSAAPGSRGSLSRRNASFNANDALVAAGQNAFGEMQELLRLIVSELQDHQHFLFEYSTSTDANKAVLHERYFVKIADRLQITFGESFLPRADQVITAFKVLGAAAIAPAQDEDSYQTWLEWVAMELNRLEGAIGTTTSLVNDLVRAIGPAPPPVRIMYPEAVTLFDEGLQRTIFQAVSKFSRRASDKKRHRLVSGLRRRDGGSSWLLFCYLHLLILETRPYGS